MKPWLGGEVDKEEVAEAKFREETGMKPCLGGELDEELGMKPCFGGEVAKGVEVEFWGETGMKPCLGGELDKEVVEVKFGIKPCLGGEEDKEVELNLRGEVGFTGLDFGVCEVVGIGM